MKYSIELLDIMEGHDFEYAVADLLRHNGWKDVEVTQGSNDYGIDILARKGRTKYAIQCKRYNNTVGVKAVQEAGLGVDYYHYDAAAVITNSTFTKQAENIAGVTGVRLWGRDYLEELIANYDDRYDDRHDKSYNTKFYYDHESYNHEFSINIDATNSGISKVCPVCGREFLSSSYKCPVCNCSLVSFSAQKAAVRTLQKRTILQEKQRQRSIAQTQIQQHAPQHTQQHAIARTTALKKKSRLQQQKPSKLSIAALILSFLGGLSAIGIILAIVDLRKKDGYKKTYSVIALVIGCSMVLLLVALDNHMNNGSVDNRVNTIASNNNSEPFSTETQNNMENIPPDNATDNIELGKEALMFNSLANNSSIKDKLLDFNYIPENNYTEIVLVGYTSGFTDKQNIEGTYFYILEVLESLQPIVDTDVSISVKYPILDVYGNSGVQDVIYAYYTLDTIQKINFESFFSKNIPVIADYWEDAINFRIQD